ncbi:MAG: hypothetical protein JO123_06295 [Ktedonobacteraceae bacterium]|nr:hypothetical protein [Ktedonobacteraceae bacterium]
MISSSSRQHVDVAIDELIANIEAVTIKFQILFNTHQWLMRLGNHLFMLLSWYYGQAFLSFEGR